MYFKWKNERNENTQIPINYSIVVNNSISGCYYESYDVGAQNRMHLE